MTDNEIINALEWCEQFENNIVFQGNGDEKCVQALQMMVVIKHALKNYNRLIAENANLTSHLTSLQNDLTSAKIVYCKDCKHRHKANVGVGYLVVCHRFNRHAADDFYCAYGEKDGNK